MSRKSNDQSLKEAMEEMLKTYKLEGKLHEVMLINSWEKVMGPTVAHRTTDIKIIDKRLIVNLNSASLREELFREREKITKLLNDEAGTEVISEVIFR
jgi:hypothetical protein